MASIINQFVKNIKSHVDEVLNPQDYSEWLKNNTTLYDLPFTTNKFPFQKQILNDMHRKLSVIKCSQVGLTEIQIRKALAIAARNPYRNVIFSLPNDDMRKRLYQTRVKPLLDATPAFNPPGEAVRSIETTQIGKSFVLFLPANEQSATSQPADCVFNDEVDLSDQEILALFNSRMQASDWRMNQKFSTPTYTRGKIDADYTQSDQHYYFYKCYACNHQQVPVFTPEFVHLPGMPDIEDLSQFDRGWIDEYKLDITKATVNCSKCGAVADLGNADLRQWVSKYPHRPERGYRVSPFSVGYLGAPYIFSELMDYVKRDFIRGWFNTVLGEAYEGGDERLSRADILQVFTPALVEPPYELGANYFIGGDVGTICHITIIRAGLNKKPEVVLFETCKKTDYAERVKALIKKYNCVSGLGDRYPEQTQADAMREQTFNVFLPTAYVNTKSPNHYEEKLDEYGGLAYIDLQRTWSLDLLVKAIRNRQISFSGYGIHKETIIAHLQDLVRVEEEGKVPKWEKQTGDDHFFHALNYAYAAWYHYYLGPTDQTENSVILLTGLDCKAFSNSATLYGGRRR